MLNREVMVFFPRRFQFVVCFITLIVIGLMYLVFDLSVIDQHFLKQQGNERVLRLMRIPAFRGMIVDRNGYPLAVSTQVFSVWINPQTFTTDAKSLSSLSQILKINPQEVKTLVNRYKKLKREFAYLKRNVSPKIAHRIKSLAIPGVYTQIAYQRYYPEGEIAAHVIGFTNVDDHGQEGLELGYNQWLSGEVGKKWVIKDRLGRVISDVKTVQTEKPGHDLMLSIDRRLQYLAYRELLSGVTINKAQSGSVVVLDVKTGEVLAMTNYPSFNPNNRIHEKADHFRNRSVTDMFEPGSTIKAFSVANALNSGKFKPDTIIDTSPIRIQRNIIRDEHGHGEPLTVTQILERSSNAGVTRMTLSLPPATLINLFHQVGFGEITGIGFPGEANGSMTGIPPAGSFTLATLSWGYGLSVTTLQLARAYAVLANAGVKLPLSLLRLEHPPQGIRVLNESIAKQMLVLLESVLEEGTGKAARVPGYRIAGKTGTARIAKNRGYEKHHHISSFVGIAPVSDPRFVVAVVIRDPGGKNYYGGDVSAPVFEKVMEGTLRTYAVSPDG